MIYVRQHTITCTESFPEKYKANDMWEFFSDCVEIGEEYSIDKVKQLQDLGLIKNSLIKINNNTFVRVSEWKSKRAWDNYAIIKPMHKQHEMWSYTFEDNMTNPNIHNIIRMNYNPSVDKLFNLAQSVEYEEYDQTRNDPSHYDKINAKGFKCSYTINDSIRDYIEKLKDQLKFVPKLKGIFQKTDKDGFLDWHIDPISSWSINIVLQGAENGILFNHNENEIFPYQMAIINTGIYHSVQPGKDRLIFKLFGENTYTEAANLLMRWW